MTIYGTIEIIKCDNSYYTIRYLEDKSTFIRKINKEGFLIEGFLIDDNGSIKNMGGGVEVTHLPLTDYADLNQITNIDEYPEIYNFYLLKILQE